MKAKIAAYLKKQVGALQSRAATTGGKKDVDREKIDDILKMVYNIISACDNLSNPSTLVDKEITFGVNKNFVPYGEEDATVLQVGMKEIGEMKVKKAPAYVAYLW